MTELEGLLVAFVASTISGSEPSPDSSEILDRLRRARAPRWLLDNIRSSAGSWSVSDDDRIDVIVHYAAKLTRASEDVVAYDTERLRSVGLSDFDIIDLENVVAYYRCVDRSVDGR